MSDPRGPGLQHIPPRPLSPEQRAALFDPLANARAALALYRQRWRTDPWPGQQDAEGEGGEALRDIAVERPSAREPATPAPSDASSRVRADADGANRDDPAHDSWDPMRAAGEPRIDRGR